jgi:hypothetical protein
MLIEGQDYTVENGLYIFTREYLLAREYCCGNGCRNCPYEPRHTAGSQTAAGQNGEIPTNNGQDDTMHPEHELSNLPERSGL